MRIRGPGLISKARKINFLLASENSDQSASFQYNLDKNTVNGLWTLQLNTELQKKNLTFTVVEFNESRVDVALSVSPTVSLNDSVLSGFVTANYSHNGLPVCGNLTMTAIIMDSKRNVLYNQVKRQFF